MKKKTAVFLLVSTLAVTMISGCSSSKPASASAVSATSVAATSAAVTSAAASAETEKVKNYQFVSAADTVKAAQTGDAHVLDVREWDKYTSGRVADSQWCPIFPLEDESLVKVMETYGAEKLNDKKNIYIVCNSGQRGAQKATEVLEGVGIDSALIYTVEGGAKALAKEAGALTTNRSEEKIDWQYVTGKEAVEKAGSADVQILDVRDDDTYKKGHLKGSLQCGLKEIENADAQTAMYKLATEKMDKEKPVYLLCYSGNKCAKTGISIMKDAGFDTSKLFVIENGAKDGDVQAAFVQD